MHHQPSQRSVSRSPAWSLAGSAALAIAVGTGCGSDAGASGPDVTGSADGADRATLNGDVTLPAGVAAGSAVQVGIASPGVGAAWTGSLILGGSMSSKSSVAHFSITDLNASDYLVFLRVDANGSGDFGSGDFGGYFTSGGSPVLDPANATVVAMSAGEIRRIDFTAATIP
jgi:hypothetical protein